jgi:hypothetical protein
MWFHETVICATSLLTTDPSNFPLTLVPLSTIVDVSPL